MTEWVTYGSVGGVAGDSRSYPEAVNGPVIGTWAPPRTQWRLHCTLAPLLISTRKHLELVSNRYLENSNRKRNVVIVL